jgi:hypothetical protein
MLSNDALYWSRDDLIIVAHETVRSSHEVARTIF